VRGCPVTGVSALPSASSAGAPPAGDLRRQAHELVGALLSLWNPGASGAMPDPARATPAGLNLGEFYPQAWAGKRCPETNSLVPTFALERDQLRRRAHEFIETLLITFNEATGEKGLPAQDQVPLLHCAAPVTPGDKGRATLTVANEETSPCEVTLYSTNFTAERGYEIPSLRVTILPRVVAIPAQGKVDFEIQIDVPQQTPRGYYCGLIQAMGSRYFKAVLSMEVL